jgi:hypothetical protein
MIGTRTKWAVSAGVLVVAAVPVAAAVPASAATVPVGNVKVVSVASPFSSSNKTLAAKCPAGTRVVGGGAQIAGAGHVVLTELRPITAAAGDSYQATAVEDEVGEAANWSLLTYAYCASGPLPGYQIVSATSPNSSNPFTGITSTCAAGSQSLGSGGQINNGNGQVDLLTLGEGGTISNRSTAAGQEDGNGFSGSWSVTAYTVCVKPNAVFDLAMVKTQVSSGNQTTATAVAACPSGKRATGGAGWADTPAHVTSITPNSVTPFQVSVVGRNTSGTAANFTVIATVFCAS